MRETIRFKNNQGGSEWKVLDGVDVSSFSGIAEAIEEEIRVSDIRILLFDRQFGAFRGYDPLVGGAFNPGRGDDGVVQVVYETLSKKEDKEAVMAGPEWAEMGAGPSHVENDQLSERKRPEVLATVARSEYVDDSGHTPQAASITFYVFGGVGFSAFIAFFIPAVLFWSNFSYHYDICNSCTPNPACCNQSSVDSLLSVATAMLVLASVSFLCVLAWLMALCKKKCC